jgi:hypothetical protein
MSLPFRTSEWDDERELRTRTLGDDVNIRRGGGGNSSREMNRDNEDIQGSHSWQGSTSTESTSRAWNPWPFNGEVGKVPTVRTIIHMHGGMLWMTLSMRKIFRTCMESMAICRNLLSLKTYPSC